MKKYGLHILIILVLIGIFSPTAQVRAETYAECIARVNASAAGELYGQVYVDSTCASLRGAATVDVCASKAGIGKIICEIHGILNLTIPVIMALGLLYFIWGVVQYVIRDSEEAKKKGRDHIIYGLIGLTIIISLWGVINIVVQSFGLSGGTAPTISAPTRNGAQMCSITELADDAKVQDILEYATCIIFKSVIPLVFALAVLMFVWGVTQYVMNSAEEAKKEKGRQFMLWGIIALTVMVSIWGLVKVLGGTFGVENPVIPQVSPAKRII